MLLTVESFTIAGHQQVRPDAPATENAEMTGLPILRALRRLLGRVVTGNGPLSDPETKRAFVDECTGVLTRFVGVRQEDVDIGITGGSLPAAEFDVIQRARDRLCLVYPKGRAIGRRRRITLKDIAGLPPVLTAPGTSFRAIVDAAFKRVHVTPIMTCEPIYMMTAVAMVGAGLGLTILPGWSPEIRAEAGLESRPIDDPSFVRPIALIKKKGRTLPPVSEAFVAVCAKALRG